MLLTDFKPTYFNLREEGDVVVGQFSVPRLSDDQNIEQLGHDLFALVEQFDKRKVVLSMSNVEYLTSSVLGKLITLHRKMHRQQGRLVLCELQPDVTEIMRISRLNDYFKVAGSLDAALQDVQSA